MEETATAGIDHTYDGSETVRRRAAALAVLDCDGDGRPDVYVAGGEQPGRAVPERRARSAARCGSSGSPTRRRTSTGVTGAYPLDIDGDGVTDLAVLAGRPDRAAPRARRLPVRARERGLGVRRRRRPSATAFSATWEGDATLPTLAFGNYLELDAAGESTTTCAPQRGHPSRRRPGPATPRRSPLTPGYCALSMLFSDWDGSGRRDLRVSNDRHYYDVEDGEEQLWRFEPGSPPRLYTADDGWVLLQLWGMGIASYDVTGDGYPEVYLTSQGPNTLQTLLAGPGPADLPRPRRTAAASRAPVRRPAAIRCRRPPGTRSSRTSTTTGSWTCSCPRATSTCCRTTRRRTRATCSSASPTARTSRPSSRVGHRALRPRARRRARRPQPRRPARPRGGQPRRAGPRLAERRGRHGRCAGGDGPLGRVPAAAARRQPGRDRRGGRDAGRRHGHRAPRG